MAQKQTVKKLRGWPYKTLILCRRGIGEITWALPLLAAMKQHLPLTQLDWVVDPDYDPLLQHRSDLNRTIRFPEPEIAPLLKPLRPLYRAFVIFVNFALSLYKRKYAASLDVEDTATSRWLAVLADARLRIGLKGILNSRILNNFRIPRDKDPARRHAVWQNLRLLSGWCEIVEPPPPPGLPISDETRTRRDEALAVLGLTPGRYLVLSPGAPWVSRTWSIEGFAAVARHFFQRYGLPSLAIWGTGERSVAWEIETQSSRAALTAPDTDLPLLIALIESSAACISVDSGPLHMASAMGKPSVGIFGPTDPQIRGPFWGVNRVVSRWPAAKKSADRSRRDETCDELRRIPASEVISATEDILTRSGYPLEYNEAASAADATATVSPAG